MSNTARVDKSMFEESHYLGKPADADDLIVQRRLRILYNIPSFIGKDLDLLEIGCGNGNTLLQLSSEFKSTVGLEYNEVHKAEFEQLKQQLNLQGAEFQVWDIMEEPFTPQADRLLSFEVIEHLPSEEGVANYAASLKQGGLAAFSVPNKCWIFETHGARLPLLPWNRVPFFSWLPTPLHERWANARIYTKRRIKKLLEKHGFEVLDMQYVMAPMDVIRWKPLQQLLRKYVFNSDTTRIPFKSVSIFVTARKK
ncbi:MAG: class I SAM-dependent methyltransferase [Sphingomonadales bacterium]|nr:class I SAM-dependent methyltransferase [Sphingomonadales bacterium]